MAQNTVGSTALYSDTRPFQAISGALNVTTLSVSGVNFCNVSGGTSGAGGAAFTAIAGNSGAYTPAGFISVYVTNQASGGNAIAVKVPYMNP